MKEYIHIHNFIYFINDTHYLKELSKKNNQKLLIEKTKLRKKSFCFQQLLLFLLSIFIYNVFSYIFQTKINNYINYLIIILSILYFYIVNFILSQFLECYNNFIKLCESIVNYDNIIRNKIKLKKYLKNNEEESINILLDTIDIMTKIITLNKDTNLNNYKNKNIIELFNEYQKLKSNLFKYIFDEYEKGYINEELYIYKYIKYIYNYKNSLYYKIQYLIIEFNQNINLLNKEKIDYESLIKDFEKYINDNIIKIEEIKKKELKNKIYDLLMSNFGLNEKYFELIKEINSNNVNDEKLKEIIEYIIEKKQLSISLLEQLKKKLNIEKEENIIDNNEIKRKNKNTFLIKNNFNNDISYFDINLNNINISKKNLNDNKTNNNLNNNNKSVKVYDIINEQEKIKDLKSSFINELNNYCKKVKGLNKDKEEKNIENNLENKIKKEENIKNGNINKFINEINEKKVENNSDMPSTKLDFAKSLTLALGKNKNFNLNFIEDKDENDKSN